MAKIKKLHSAGFKFKVALTAVIGELTMADISQKFKIHNSQISAWKKLLLENGAQIFEHNATPTDKKTLLENEELYEQIGRLSVERDFLKKTLDL